jgi:GrpB-like predicted nucleotidyltransferase (UPF0157 family)
MDVVVVPYDGRWPEKFSREADEVVRALGATAIRIHHIGSTSIVGMYAKPVIDMLLEVESLERLEASQADLVALGYRAMGEFGIPGRRHYRKSNAAGVRQFHLHAYALASQHTERHLAFRDFMRLNEHLAIEYSELKRRLAYQHPDSIEEYQNGKDAFIRAVENRALQWRRST